MNRKLIFSVCIIALAAAALALFPFGSGIKENKAIKEALDTWDLTGADLDYFVPYNSTAFTPTDIPSGRANDGDIAVLRDFISTLEPDKKAEDDCRGNTLISITVNRGSDRLVITVTDGDACLVQLSQGPDWLTASYTFDDGSREALLARGGLPSVEEIAEGVERRFKEIENGYKDKEPPLK